MRTLLLPPFTSIIALAACVGSKPTPDVPPVDPNARVRVATSPTPAPWRTPGARVLQAELGLGAAEQLAVGLDVALWRSTRGVFALGRERGVLGRLDLPEGTGWVGLGAGDSVLAATRSGALWRSPDPHAALDSSSYVRVGGVDGAGAWDASPGHVLAMTPTELFVSTDDGDTFATVTVLEGAWMRAALARPDGVLVAIVEAGSGRHTLFSRDDGQTWSPSGFHPQRLRRDGSWIWNGDVNCPAIMGADPGRWSADPSFARLPGWKDPRRRMLRLADTVVPTTKGLYATALDPAPPTVDPTREHRGRSATCLDPIPGEDVVLEPRSSDEDVSERGPHGPPCQGTQCLRESSGAGAPPSRVVVSLLADATCDTPTCDAVSRPPHMLEQDLEAGSVRTLSLPDGCHPERLFDAGGLAVLTCRAGGGVRVHTRASSADAWSLEGSFDGMKAADLTSHSVVDDGTLVLHGACPTDSECAPSLLRAPKAQAGQGAWAAVSAPGLVYTRPLPGGEALAVTLPGSSVAGATVWRMRDGSLEEVVTIGGIDEPLRDVSVREDGVLTVRVGDAFAPARFEVTRGGELVPVGERSAHR